MSTELDSMKYLGELSDDREAWQFDMFTVWYVGDRLYWASDSGCSCPIPYEDYRSLSDYCTGSKQECIKAIKEWVNGDPYYASDAMDLQRKVREFEF